VKSESGVVERGREGGWVRQSVESFMDGWFALVGVLFLRAGGHGAAGLEGRGLETFIRLYTHVGLCV
jgi:hypothetical protein